VRCCAPPDEGYNWGGLIDATSSISSMSTSDFEPYTHGPRGTRLYRNDGSTFTNVTNQFDLDDDANVRNLTWVDYDRDGDLDLHVLAKGDAQAQNEDDILYRNRTTYFTDETSEQDIEGPANGLADACAWEDFDKDGDFDVAVLSGAPPKAYAVLERDRLYENDSQNRNELRVNLEGTASNRDGIGAWVTCNSDYAGTQSHYVTANAWRGGQVVLDPYFAIRDDNHVNLLRVEWPSGIVSEMTNVPAGEVTVTEQGGALDAPVAPAPRELRLAVRRTPSVGSASFVVDGALGVPGELEIFDTSGRRVHQIRFDAAPASIEWNGTDGSGRRVANGVYYAVLQEGKREARAKVVMLR
jgi:hypothetical protein